MEVWELKLSAIHHLVVKTLKCSHFPATRLLHSMFFLTTSLYLFSCQGRQPKETSHRCPGLVRVKTTALSARPTKGQPSLLPPALHIPTNGSVIHGGREHSPKVTARVSPNLQRDLLPPHQQRASNLPCLESDLASVTLRKKEMLSTSMSPEFCNQLLL